MMNLKSEQQRLFALMPQDARCFVKLCDDDRALWVSDLPRRTEDLPDLTVYGYHCELDEKSRLWYIDWTQERRQALLADLPTELPAFPPNERFHEAYALCRLWMNHPGHWNEDTAPIIRRVLKLTAQKEEKLLSAVPALTGLVAKQLRLGKTNAYPAGQILCEWLKQRKENDE